MIRIALALALLALTACALPEDPPERLDASRIEEAQGTAEPDDPAEPDGPEPEEPESATLDEDAQQALFALHFRDSRAKLADAIEEDFIVESVDAIRFKDGTVVIEATSGYSTDEYVEDEGWELTRELAFMWGDDFWGDVDRDPMWNPDFSLTISDLEWDCPGKLMRRPSQRDASRSDWEDRC